MKTLFPNAKSSFLSWVPVGTKMQRIEEFFAV